MADRLMASTELQELNKTMAKPPPPTDPVIPEGRTSKMSIQSEDSLSKTVALSTEEPSTVTHPVSKKLSSLTASFVFKVSREVIAKFHQIPDLCRKV
jgi:hypothetical protein